MTDKVFLITGASAGIGAAVARQAVQAGYRVVLAARSLASLEALQTELGGPERVLAVRCDVAQWADQQALIAAIRSQFGRLDVALANAGVVKGASSFYKGEPTPDEWREMIMTNVYGTALTVRAALPELIQTQGHLLVTGSVLGRFFVPGTGWLYGATKWAVTGMVESIRQELRGTGVRVSHLMPGRVATQFAGEVAPNHDDPTVQPDDVARAVLYAVAQPPHVAISEIIIRPTGQQD